LEWLKSIAAAESDLGRSPDITCRLPSAECRVIGEAANRNVPRHSFAAAHANVITGAAARLWNNGGY